MTATDQDTATERAARELERRLRRVTALPNPYAAGTEFVQWLISEGWYCRVQPPEHHRPGSGTPPTPEFEAAKAAITRKEARHPKADRRHGTPEPR